ncbi:MAG: tRNA (cytidine(34)-2'-O)-methyltransferase [Candidatus Nanopelagicales bacterium]
MLHIALFSPRIPPNTGNAIRLCANTGATLHLIEPLGFDLSDAHLRRAGLDYHDLARVELHPDLATARGRLGERRWLATSAHAATRYDRVTYGCEDVLLFGPEPTGLPAEVLAEFPAEQRIRIPMLPASRSLNLANAIAVTVYEAWRQLGFPGASDI